MTLVLYPRQVEGAEFLKSHRGALLEDSMGVGKTVQAVAAATDIVGPILVICRPLNKAFWRKMIGQLDPTCEGVIEAERGGYFDQYEVEKWFKHNSRGYLLIHHEMLSTPTNKKTGEALRDHASLLRTLGAWSLVIADEAHRFANRNSQMTKSLKSITTFRKWALTGTMMEKSPADYWSILNWFDKNRFYSYHTFAGMYTVVVNTPWGSKSTVGKNLPAFARELSRYRLKRTKQDVNPNMVAMERYSIPIEMSSEQRDLYREAKKKTFLRGDLEDPVFIASALARLSYLRKITLDPGLIGSEVFSPKSQWLLEWQLDNRDTPFVVFTHSREYAHQLTTLLDRTGVIAGDVKQSERTRVMDSFLSGKLQGLTGTMDTMSESINLQRARISFFPELHWKSRAVEQAEARIYRIDSPEDVEIVRLISPDTVDEVVEKALEQKASERQLVESFLKHLQGS